MWKSLWRPAGRLGMPRSRKAGSKVCLLKMEHIEVFSYKKI